MTYTFFRGPSWSAGCDWPGLMGRFSPEVDTGVLTAELLVILMGGEKNGAKMQNLREFALTLRRARAGHANTHAIIYISQQTSGMGCLFGNQLCQPVRNL